VKPTNINLCIQIDNEFTILLGKAFSLISQVKIDNRYKESYWLQDVTRRHKTRCIRHIAAKKLN